MTSATPQRSLTTDAVPAAAASAATMPKFSCAEGSAKHVGVAVEVERRLDRAEQVHATARAKASRSASSSVSRP